jgi:hypothetical protein
MTLRLFALGSTVAFFVGLAACKSAVTIGGPSGHAGGAGSHAGGTGGQACSGKPCSADADCACDINLTCWNGICDSCEGSPPGDTCDVDADCVCGIVCDPMTLVCQ